MEIVDIISDFFAEWEDLRVPCISVPGLVSVVLPTYNRALFLPEAMNSVWAQTYRPVELLVVDDGSSDNTAEGVKQTVAMWPDDPAFRVVYVVQSNRGASAARNQGLLHSRGEFIQYLDSDDVLVQHKLATHVHVLQADESLDIVWSDWEVAPSDELAERLEAANRIDQPPEHVAWEFTDKTICWEPWPTLTRRRFIAQHPLWNERTSRWDDWEYALRLMAAHPKRAFAAGLLCIQREHEQGRRHDFDFDPVGITKGLVAAHEAGKARDRASEASPELDQRVAERYWELFIEGIHHGSPANAMEALKGASVYARRGLFRTKASLMQIFLRIAGTTVTRAILRGRYMSTHHHIGSKRRSGGIAIAMDSFRRECQKGYGFATWWFLTRCYLRFVKGRIFFPPTPTETDAQRRITVVVPAAEKDAPVLAHCLRSIREMIRHELVEIWVVAPESITLRGIAAAENCRFVHEDEILPRPVAELKCRGWVLQQFIKLNAAALVSTPDYLVVDSDTVFLRPQSFFRRGRAVLRYSDQYELLYNRSLELAFGHPRRFPVSFVTHHMLFNVALVKELLHLIEKRFGCPWWEAILHRVDQGHPISFSEYELYGHLVVSRPKWRKDFALEYWHGQDRSTGDLADLEEIRRAANGRSNNVSFHWHTQ